MLLAVFGAAGLLFAALTLFGEVCHDRRQGHYRRRIIPKCEAFCTTGDTSRLRRRAGSARGPDARRGSDRAGNGPSSPVARGKSAERHVHLGQSTHGTPESPHQAKPQPSDVVQPGAHPGPGPGAPAISGRCAGWLGPALLEICHGVVGDKMTGGGRFLFLRQKSGNRAHEVTLGSSFFCPGPCRRFRGERHDRMPAIS